MQDFINIIGVVLAWIGALPSRILAFASSVPASVGLAIFAAFAVTVGILVIRELRRARRAQQDRERAS